MIETDAPQNFVVSTPTNNTNDLDKSFTTRSTACFSHSLTSIYHNEETVIAIDRTLSGFYSEVARFAFDTLRFKASSY